MKQPLVTLSCFYCVCLAIANIASNKIINLFGYDIDGGCLIFPLTFLVNDIITEVYGYKISRQIIWTGFYINIFVTLMIFLLIKLPSSSHWAHQESFELIFGSSYRICIASSLSYIIGELLNASILTKLKNDVNVNMPLRFIISNIISISIENTVFYIIAFSFILPPIILFQMMLFQYVIKIIYDILFVPISCLSVQYINKIEGSEINNNSNF